MCNHIADFLDIAACLTIAQAGTIFITITYAALAYKKLPSKLQLQSRSEVQNFEDTGNAMVSKLRFYESNVRFDLSRLARSLSPSFGHDMFLLRKGKYFGAMVSFPND